jgi:hypothetical protein
MEAAGGADRRRRPRFDVGDLPGSLAFATDVEVLNLSVAGMAVATRMPIENEKRLAVTLGRPPDTVALHGTVCWCRAVPGSDHGEGPVYHAGLRFADVLTDRARQLIDFMERNIVVALDHQLFGRLNLQGEEVARLEGDWRFVIRKISTSGMLIATSLEPRIDERYDMEVNLDGRRFATRGRIVNIAADGPSRLLGVAFESLPEDAAVALREFIRRRVHPLPEPS